MTRVLIKSQQAKYDSRHDVLHVVFQPIESSFEDEDFPGVIIRRSIINDRITGIVILDYSKRSKNSLRSFLPHYDFNKIILQ